MRTRRPVLLAVAGVVSIVIGALSLGAATIASAVSYNLEEVEEGTLTDPAPVWVQIWGYGSIALGAVGLALLVLALLAARPRTTQKPGTPAP